MRRLIIRRFGILSAQLVLLLGIFAPAAVSAVDVLQVCNDPNTAQQAQGSVVCKEQRASDGKNPIFGPEGVLTRAIQFLSVIVAIASVIVIIVAGLKYVTSGSNPQDVGKAREMILYAVVGLVIAGLAQALVRFFLNTLQGS